MVVEESTIIPGRCSAVEVRIDSVQQAEGSNNQREGKPHRTRFCRTTSLLLRTMYNFVTRRVHYWEIGPSGAVENQCLKSACFVSVKKLKGTVTKGKGAKARNIYINSGIGYVFKWK